MKPVKLLTVAGLTALLCVAMAAGAWAQGPAESASGASPVASPAPSPSSPAAASRPVASRPVVIYTQDNAPAAPKLESLPLMDSVSRHGITWTFERPARVGRFVNGDWYIVGPATVVAIDPKPLFGDEVKEPNQVEVTRYKGLYARNGSVKNPTTQPNQTAFDSRMLHTRYKAESFVKLPASLKPGDVLMSSISLTKAGKATIKAEGLKGGTKVEVVGEGRTITAEEGQLTDEFAPLAEHVYTFKQ